MWLGSLPSLHRIELALEQMQRPWLNAGVRFPQDFEVAFERGTRRERLVHARVAIVIAVLFYNAFLLVDHACLPQRFHECLTIRLILSVLVPPLFWLPVRRSWLQELIYATAFIPFAAAVVYLYRAPSEVIAVGQAAVLMILMYEIAFVRPRFLYIASAAAACVVADSIFLALKSALHGPTTIMLIGLLIATGLTSLFAAYWLERQERIAFLLRLHIETQKQESGGANSDVARLTTVDSVTGIPNRRFLDSHLPAVWKQCSQHQQPISALMIGLDHFRVVNDQYGHSFGDTVLREVARVLSESIRGEHDLLTRYCGEQFSVILPNLPLGPAVAIGERVCTAVRRIRLLPPKDGFDVRITVSVGAASSYPAVERSPMALLHTADLALYSAKHNGRDQVFPNPDAA